MKRVLAVALTLLTCAVPAHAAPTAQEVIKATDRIRSPEGAFSTRVTLTEYVSARPRDSVTLLIHSKQETGSGQYRTLAAFVEPVRDAGKVMLRQGTEVWFFDPAAKSSVRISPQQRLLGQSSNGDVMTSNFALDYDVTLDGAETVKDLDKRDRRCLRLRMKASNPAATYDGIEYWVEDTDFRPVKGKFYSESGRLLKVAYYSGYRPELGVERPTEVVIIDGVDTTKVTRMRFADYRLRDIPESWFQRSYLPRFRPD